jgi:hypothetical protein
MHVHNDRIMTAKQKRLEAQGFVGARVTSPHFNFKLLPILGRTCGPEACRSVRCEGTTPKVLIRTR